MTMIRPEAAATLKRWRDALIGAAIVATGTYGALSASGMLQWISTGAVLLGLALFWEGIRRARFPMGTGGPGVVEVTERQITYFGPTGGAAISINDLKRIEVETTGERPSDTDLFWWLYCENAPALRIPGDAAGVSSLYDALTALPGIRHEKVIDATGLSGPARVVIWQKPGLRLH